MIHNVLIPAVTIKPQICGMIALLRFDSGQGAIP